MILTEELLLLSTVLFLTGLLGVLIKSSAIAVFLCIELMFNAANLSLIAFASHYHSHHGLILAFFVVILAAAEAVVGLAIVLNIHRLHKNISLGNFSMLRN